MFKRLAKILLLSLAIFLVASMPVLAAVVYRATYTITEGSSNSYAMLAVSGDADNEWAADNGFITSTALDTRVETSGGAERQWMVCDDKLLTAIPVPADSQTNLYYTTANTPASSFDIITGYDGYVTTDYAAALECGNDFDIEVSGYVDTSDSNFKYIMQKRDSVSIAITDTSEISGIIYFEEPEELTVGASGAWTDVDITAYVPAHATGAVIHYTASATLQLGLRINGSGDDLRDDVIRHGWTMVGIDASDIFECYMENHGAEHIYLVGYTGSGVTYKTNADDISLGGGDLLAWTDIDVSTEAPDAIGVIVFVDNTDAVNARESGLRKNGSADNRHPDTDQDSFYYGIVGCDASQVIEGYIETVDVDFYLTGYITDDFTFNTNADDKSIAGGAAWTDIDCSAQVTSTTTHLIFEVVGDGNQYGFRRNGSAENLPLIANKHEWVVVECDDDQIVEGWAATASVDFYLVGYTEGYIDSPHELIASATPFTPDDYVVDIDADSVGATFKIYIDSGEEDSVALGAVSAPDVAETDWVINVKNCSPYINYYEHTVSGTLIADYEPVTMILGTTLPDKEGAAQNGTFTFGSNPAGVTVAIGSMVSATQPIGVSTTTEEARDIMPSVEVSDWFGDHTVSGDLLTNPLRPFVTMVSDNTDITELQTWRLLALGVILIVAVLTSIALRGHQGITVIMAGMAVGGAVVLTIFPLWCVVFAIGMFISGLVMERSPSL